MSKIVYVGFSAGLTVGSEVKAGNMNSPFDYVVYCSCEALLGPLGRFTANKDGIRTPWCPQCSHCTAIGKDGQIKAVFKVDLSKKAG